MSVTTLPRGGATALACRVIPCLDVAEGRVVKGVQFEALAGFGSPAEAARRYCAPEGCDAALGADEIVFLDIAASHERRGPALSWIEEVAESVFVPLTVGGGVRTLDDARNLLAAGADKVALNSAAVERPSLLTELAERYGSQSVVLSVDARRRNSNRAAPAWEVVTQGGRKSTGRDPIDWIAEGVALGAGEILLTSIDRDGTGDGFDCELIAAAAARVNVPIIASGGAGRVGDFAAALGAGAAAVLAAGLFHRQEMSVPDVKRYLAQQGFSVRGVS
ncbi:MAG: imidazole glycerol phosphate synthase subunit HisF [Thermoanaerobaculia bacterium]